MKSKQILGLVIAAILFVFVTGTGMLLNKQSENLLHYFSSSANVISSLPTESFIGVVEVNGVMQNVGSSTFLNEVDYDHNGLIQYVRDLEDSSYNEGILLYVNSPGGVVYDVHELYLALMEYKNNTNRPIIAYFANSAMSGGYYVAMAADEIYANTHSTLGSIGVIISTYDYSELMQKLGIKAINIVSGNNKAAGAGDGGMTDEQIGIYQSIVDEAFEGFLEVVMSGRNMEREQLLPLADGRIYTAKQGLEHQLIDQIATYDECLDALSEQFGGQITFYYQESPTSWQKMFTQIKSTIPKTESQVLRELLNETEKNGGLMYYAEPY